MFLLILTRMLSEFGIQSDYNKKLAISSIQKVTIFLLGQHPCELLVLVEIKFPST